MFSSFSQALSSIEAELDESVSPQKSRNNSTSGTAQSDVFAATPSDKPERYGGFERFRTKTKAFDKERTSTSVAKPIRRSSTRRRSPVDESPNWDSWDSTSASSTQSSVKASSLPVAMSKLDGMDRDQLLAHCQKQTLLLRKTKTKMDELKAENDRLKSGGNGEAQSLEQTGDSGDAAKYKRLALQLKKSNKDKDAQIKDLQEQLSAQSTDTNMNSDAVLTLETSLAEARTELDATRASLKASQAGLEEKTMLVTSLQEQLSAVMAADADNIDHADKGNHADKDDQSDTLTELEAQLEKLSSDNSELLGRWQTSRNEVKALSAEMDKLKALQASIDADKDTSDKDNEAADKIANEVAEAKDAAVAQASELQGQLEHAQAELTAANQQLAARSAEMSALTTAKSELSEDLDNAMAQIERLEAELRASTDKLDEELRKHAADSNDNANEHASGDQSATEELVTDLQELQDKLAITEQQLRAVKGELSNSQQHLDEAQGKMRASEEHASALNNKLVSFEEQLAESQGQLSTAQEQASNLQTERDALRQQLDQLTSDQKDDQGKLQGELIELRSQLKARDTELAAMAALHREKAQLEAQVSELQGEVEEAQARLEQESEASSTTVQRMVADINALKAKISQDEISMTKLQAELSEEQASHKATRSKLTEASADLSASTMLDLELADYQRTVDNLHNANEQLQKDVAAAKERESQLDTAIGELKAQLAEADETKSKLEGQKKILMSNYKKAKMELEAHNSQLQTQEQSVTSAQDAVKEANEQARQLQEQLDQLTDTNVHLEAAHREAEMAHDVEKRELHFKLTSAQRDVQQAQSELASVNAEFQKYKVRVHNVLKEEKQRQEVQQAKDQVEELAQSVTRLETQLAERDVLLKESQSSYSQLEDHYASLEQDMQRVKQSAQDRATAAETEISRLRELVSVNSKENEELTARFQSELQQINADARLRINAATEKAEAKQAEQADLVARLRAQVEDLQDQLLKQPASEDRRSTTPVAVDTTATRSIDVSHLVSQGSSQKSTRAGSRSDFADLISGSSRAESDGRANALAGLTPDQLKEAITKSQHQVAHLTALLHDSEANNDRLTEQLKLLKTEIRQEERADARDPLNLEYLKNVILQFLMKQEERPQLVPVLAMLLQFSPEEHRQLQQFQVEPATASEGSAWNSYFPRF